ncbi:Exopolysaccharide biosynthesis protein related to N-acetylglucosamine-1-phosphodiester alpha-N-acetylglucosaminidase [Legionella wadsworthii]|uniref:Exopolysaccharide biosynthesis protein related to N-acetylglucosamine-1-phosphodiester alpha-N-acetylglucosaminidase n=1 Tax=Legionella wadsworthii TaxID=28088 RepID=A0A378LUI6_9GAMM|nr:phosphodiester glycosidase family protein [Legionella wadsworthii]STY29489.1 Exopolysaccharide biosynthesis protein related to N-acetylglucosamine-1-phosphodiester alpha-N-acetylglucosaminidase [Legionella wadsworthii]
MSSQTNVYHANKFNLFRFLFVLPILFFPFSSFAEGYWRILSPGIEYQDLAGGILAPWSHIYAFRIDLNKNKLSLINAKKLLLKNASADQFAEHSKALLSINGGFFDHEFNPLGLRINNKKLVNPLKRISWWGIFYIKNNKAFISSVNHFAHDQDIDFAIQSGPRLLIKRKIPSLKPGIADRTALGITEDGKLIILVTTSAAMTTNKLAHILRSEPLSCIDAINLDGGSSSQLYAHIGSFLLNVHGFSNVSDAIIVKKRKNAR